MELQKLNETLEMIGLLYKEGNCRVLLIIKDNFQYWPIVDDEVIILNKLNECIESLLKEVILPPK